MALNPHPGYGSAPSSPYRSQQAEHGASQRPHTPGPRRNPQPQIYGRAQTPQGGFRNGNGSSNMFGRREGIGNGGWNEDRPGMEQSGKPPRLHTSVEAGRDQNLSPKVMGAARPYHASPVSQFREPQFDRYQQDEFHMSSRDRVMQPPQVPHEDLPTEPVFDDESTENDTDYYNMGNSRGDHRDYGSQPLVQRSAASKTMASDPRSERGMPREQQNYAEIYRQELVQGNGGPVSDGLGADLSHALVGGGRAQVQSSWPHQDQTNMSTQRLIPGRAPSSELVAWDSPFPAFGVKKKTPVANDGMDLNTSMSKMRLNAGSRLDAFGTQRPQTASSKSSQTSSRAWQRGMDESGAQRSSSPRSQRPSDSQFEFGVIRPPPGRLGQRTSVERFTPHGRQSEDTRIRPSMEPNSLSNIDNQRSRTMPTNISRVVHDFGSQGGYDKNHLWQEPGPNAGDYGPESRSHLEPKPAKNFSHGTAYQPSSTPHEADKVASKVEVPLRGSSNYPHHSAHNSLGEVYDSYYHESVHDQQIHGQKKISHPAESFDEDMPDFDAVPASRLGHRRGMTIDDHLQPQVNISDSVEPLAEGQRDPEASRQNAHIAGPFNRSKSQPNLKDEHLQHVHYNDGFVFDLPGDAPPLPLISPQRDTFAHSSSSQARYPGDEGYMTGQKGRVTDAQRGVPADVRSNGRAILNDSYQKAFEDGSRPGRYRSPPLQNEFIPQGPGMGPPRERTPANAILPTSASAKSSNNPDALPLHPTPIRPGLMQDSMHFQSAKPPPVRQYNSSPSSIQHRDPAPMQGTPRKTDRQSIPVTHEELDRLRRAVKAKPSDQKTQLLLAKKMVEASMILADDGGRADSKTTNRNRERYILDAHRIVKKLVNGHSAEATFYLADCYSCGLLGLEADPKEAFTLYQTAAKAGHAQSAYRVAVCYEMGQEDGGGTRRDPNKAVHWYQRAATMGDTPAMYKIGVILLKGLLGQQQNPNEALKWLKRAAEQADEENPHALHELGLLYEGAGPKSLVKTDLEYSKQLFMQAANLGYKFSQFRLGCAYEYGLKGCPIDPRQSIAWYSKAAVQEEHQSELALSGWYLTGSEGVLLQSDTEAYLWARKAAQAGLAKAEYAIGYFTEVGIGVPANVEDAKRWYWRAASQNFPKARERLEALRKGGASIEKSRVSRSAIRKQTEGDCTIM